MSASPQSPSQSLADRAVARNPSTVERIDYLDGWRGMAIVLVLASHFAGLSILEAGRFGVDVFFVLSGMLMSRILFVHRTPLPLFYKRRISRIFPVFLLFVGTIFTFAYFQGLAFGTSDVLATLAFARTYIPSDVPIWESEVPIGHLWSLNVEEHGYVILSLLAAAIVSIRKNAIVLFGLAFLSLVATVGYVKFATEAPADFGLRTECAATCLMASAGYFLIRERITPYVRGWMPPLALLGAAACYLEVGVPWWSKSFLAPFFLAFSVNHLGESYGLFLQLFNFAPLRLMGIYSYSVYLWQQPFYKFQADFPGGDFAPVLAFGATMLVSLASFYWFENPTRAWLNDKLGSYPKHRAATAA